AAGVVVEHPVAGEDAQHPVVHPHRHAYDDLPLRVSERFDRVLVRAEHARRLVELRQHVLERVVVSDGAYAARFLEHRRLVSRTELSRHLLPHVIVAPVASEHDACQQRCRQPGPWYQRGMPGEFVPPSPSANSSVRSTTIGRSATTWAETSTSAATRLTS